MKNFRAGECPWRSWQIVRFTVGYLSHGLGDLCFILLTIPLGFLPRYRYHLVCGMLWDFRMGPWP